MIMPPLALLANRFVIAGVAFALLGAWGAWNRHQFNAVTDAFQEYRVGVEVAGRAAKAAAEARTAYDVSVKGKTDADYQKNVAGLNARIAGLRNASTSTGVVPAAPASTVRPDLACFDRAELIGAVGNFVVGIRAVTDEGAAATLALDSAKSWGLMLEYRLR